MKNKVLIVDDDIDSTIILQTMAQNLGFYTQVAINGIDAINYIKEDTPDLVLLDIFMPQMDGYETIDYIKKEFDLPIIVVTAGGSETINKIKNKGIKNYIQKPIDPKKFHREIDNCLNLNKK